MYRLLAAVAVTLALAACGFAAAAPPETASDVELYLTELERIHPNPYHATSKADYRTAADRLIARLPELDDDQLMVELLRLVALLGERDGHANMNPLARAPSRAPLLPARDVRVRRRRLRHRRAGPNAARRPQARRDRRQPIADVLRLVDPLVTYDNALSRASHRSPYLVSAEILHGLGITPTPSRAVFSVEGAAGTALTPVAAGAYVNALRPTYPTSWTECRSASKPLFVAEARHVAVADDDRQGSRPSTSPTTAFRATRWRSQTGSFGSRAGRRRAASIIDLRNNGGGDINTYPYLLTR